MLERAKVRGGFERRFTVERMAHGYLDVYRGLPGVARNAAPVQRANGHLVALRNIATEGFVRKRAARLLRPSRPKAQATASPRKSGRE
jgi:hypothetical protein